MEVVTSSRQTDVGTIPEDWDARELAEIFSISAGGDLVTESFSPVEDEEHCYPIYCNALSNRGVYGYSKQHRYDGESVTVTARGTIGVAHRRVGRFDAIGRVLVMKPTVELSCGFVSEYLNQRVQFAIESTGVPQLTAPQIAKYKVALPPYSEQTSIAAALADADALIAGLEKLIAKKQNIKKGAMQMLLTGKKRLPGFRGEWEERKLGAIAEIRTGSKDVNEGNPDGEFPFFTCSREHTHCDSYSFEGEAILIAGNGEVGNLHYCDGKFEAYQRTYVLQRFQVNVRYLWYQLSAFLKSSLGIGTIGSSIPYIKRENLHDYSLPCPRESEEQAAIAQVVSDMDSEIASLERKLGKYRLIKQGMMEELLTGKKRLV